MSMCGCVHWSKVATKVIRDTRSYRWVVSHLMWMQGIDLWSFWRAVHAFDFWSVSPVPPYSFVLK